MRIRTLLIITLLAFSSCVKDAAATRKERMLVIYKKMNKALENKNMKWFQKNFYNEMPQYITEDFLFENEKSLRNFTVKNSGDESEYSVTFKHKASDYITSSEPKSSFVIRKQSLQPNYYYVMLIYDKNKNDWKISDIVLLPLK